eukprot:4554008-Prymnesium_polylepis.1
MGSLHPNAPPTRTPAATAWRNCIGGVPFEPSPPAAKYLAPTDDVRCASLCELIDRYETAVLVYFAKSH